MARQLAGETGNPVLRQLMEAVARSNRLMGEDLLREAGYMLPQSGNAHALLKSLVENPPEADFPKDIAEKLLQLLPDNDEAGLQTL